MSPSSRPDDETTPESGPDTTGAVTVDVVWTIVVGGGSGRRFGRLKQFEPIDGSTGERVIDRSISVAASISDGIVVVVPPAVIDDERARLTQPISSGSTSGPQRPVVVVGGGDSRSASVRHGLAQVPDSASIICVHDAARPCASQALYRRAITAVQDGADAAVPALAVVDTIKVIDDDGWVVTTPPRSSLVAVQTPQAFTADALRRAHRSEDEGSDDASLVESNGGRVRIVDGERTNIKVTHPDDLARLPEMLAGGEVGSGKIASHEGRSR